MNCFLHSPEVCAPVSVCVRPNQAAPSEAPHPIDQPHVCLTVPLGAIWHPPLIFPSSLPIHLTFVALSISSCASHSLLRPTPPRLAFCLSASLLSHSLPINLVCLGGRGGLGRKDISREVGLLKGREVQLWGHGGGRE